MSSSLHQLLADEGFNHDHSPIYICHNTNTTSKKNMKLGSSHRLRNQQQPEQPLIDQVAIKAVVSILSSYVGRYLKDPTFRKILRQKCSSCFHMKNDNFNNDDDEVGIGIGVLRKLELGIQRVENLVVECHDVSRMEILKDTIKLLTVVASLNSHHSKNSTTSGISNTFLSACAQFYIAVVYKIEKNDRICARHLLQVFCDSPFLARTHLLPDLWDQFFLPHLLHLKIWYANEMELVLSSDSVEKEAMSKSLSRVYNDQLDWGTAQFAVYYKRWLKVGDSDRAVPFVPLPVRPSYSLLRRTSSDAVSSSSTAKRSLYSAVFGLDSECLSTDLDYQNGIPAVTRQIYEVASFSQGAAISASKEMNTDTKLRNRSCRPTEVKLLHERRKVSSFQFLNCQTAEPAECLDRDMGKKKSHLASIDLSKAIGTICSSNSLSDCEIAVRIIAKAWLESHSDIQNSVSKPPVIVGILEVLFGSENDEILELAVSLLAELVSINEVLRQVILNSDPQLEIFIKLLKSSSLFLKASVLLHLVKPMARQMISPNWIPLSLRVLEFGDQLQTLFTVRSSPEAAAFHFLEQLLTGFDEDKNLENARQLVSIGGLTLLVKMMDRDDISQKHNIASILYYCLRADGSCRNYLVNNLNIPALFELLILGSQNRRMSCAVAMLTELLCIDRRSSTSISLSGLLNNGGKLNLMQVLLVHLHRAPPEEQPFVAVILLQLDLLGDPSKYSIYRGDVVDTIIETLNRKRCKEDLREQAVRALLILGGRFTYKGESCVENWLLKQAGFTSSSSDSIHGDLRAGIQRSNTHVEDEDATARWQRKVSIALFSTGKERLMASLTDAIASDFPGLARACLVTVSWMSIYLSSVRNKSIISMAVSALMPQLVKCLSYNRDVEERVLACFSILNLVKSSDCCMSVLSLLDENVMSLLGSLSSATWTASELVSMNSR
ncbi:hypothetical protein QQ045_021391 [Rhodiola kirilowii]